jgi:hypothetical protein
MDGVKTGTFISGLLKIFKSPLGETFINLAGRPLLFKAGKMLPKKALLRFGTELIGGYIKWKAVELGYRGVRAYLKARRRKNAERTEDSKVDS